MTMLTLTNTVVTAMTTADMSATRKASRSKRCLCLANETFVTFSLSNPNAERVEVTFSLSPTASVSYTAGGNPFNPTTGLALTARGEADIRIARGLVSNTSYTLTLTTKDTNGNAHATNTVVSFNTLPPPTQVPTNFVALGRKGQVLLSWTPASNVATNARYVIYRGGNVLTTVNEPGYYDADVINGRQYTYKVAEINDGGEGPFTPQKSARPTSGDPLSSMLTLLEAQGLNLVTL